MARPNVVKLVGVDSKNGEIIAVYISHELSGYKGKFVPDRPHGKWEEHVERKNLNTRKCTSCGEYGAVGYFCMWCGADMMREGEEQ